MRTKQFSAAMPPMDEGQQAHAPHPHQLQRVQQDKIPQQPEQKELPVLPAHAEQAAQAEQSRVIAVQPQLTPQAPMPLLPLPSDCIVGSFVQRRKRFSVELELHGESVWVHSNNSGSMLGLTRSGCPVLASPATNPARKLKYTQECVWLPQTATPAAPVPPSSNNATPAIDTPTGSPPATAAQCVSPGFWEGVNSSVPNRMLEAAFHAGRLTFASGYTSLTREAKRGQSRLDGLITGPGLPPLWVECKNVTMVEDDAACFPDAASERGQKHLRELMDIVAQGERAAMFYLVQRQDGRCFAPANFIDPEYARLFYEALACGVEMYPYRALVSRDGIDLGGILPLRPTP